MEQQNQQPGAAPDQQKKGFSFLKCCAIVGCIGIVIAGILGFMAYKKISGAIVLDPVKVASLSNEIVPCEVPTGYKGMMGMNMMGVKFTMIVPQSMTQGQAMPGGPPLMIVLMTMPQKQPKDQLKTAMEQQLAKQGHQVSAEKSEVEKMNIRGKPVEMEKQITKDAQGNSMIAYVVVLEQDATDGNPAGQEIIWCMGNEKNFDKKAFESFLGSIK